MSEPIENTPPVEALSLSEVEASTEVVSTRAAASEVVLEEVVEEVQEVEEITEVHPEASSEEHRLQNLLPALEAVLFASGETLSRSKLEEVLRASSEKVLQLIDLLKQRYRDASSGLELVDVAGAYQLRTKLIHAPYVRELKAQRPRRLSSAALETLAVIAYRQPIVKSDIEAIRGVDVTPTLKTVIERGLVRIAGHQASVGSPALYATTDEFLRIFGLKSLGELPTLKDIREFEREPGEASADADSEQAAA